MEKEAKSVLNQEKNPIKITMIHGQNHKGSTYHIGKMVADKLGGELTEFFLPRDFGEFCVGCTLCFLKTETLCPHYAKLQPIVTAMDEADVLIFTSPVYVYHVTGSMKAFLDHFGYRWMVHRPEASMFSKQAVLLTTAAGGGMKSTLKDLSDSMYFWGVAKTIKFGMAVHAVAFEEIPGKKRRQIDIKTTEIAKKVKQNMKDGTVRPGWKTKAFFFMMHLVQKKGWNRADAVYWKEKGWTKGKRPW